MGARVDGVATFAGWHGDAGSDLSSQTPDDPMILKFVNFVPIPRPFFYENHETT